MALQLRGLRGNPALSRRPECPKMSGLGLKTDAAAIRHCSWYWQRTGRI
jgi:hypothetical protein